MSVKITATMKSYDDLRAEYGLQPGDKVDDKFDSFLKKIADKKVVLTNYNPGTKSFDPAFIVEDPNQPGQERITFPNGYEAQYQNNLGINLLVDGSLDCQDCDTSIYCTKCGFVVDKTTRYDFEPMFSFGDIFDGLCKRDDDPNQYTVGVTNYFKPCIPKDSNEDCDGEGGGASDGESACLMYCVKCREYHLFKELSKSFE